MSEDPLWEQFVATLSDFEAVEVLLDRLHEMASKGRLAEYLACFGPKSIFVGTDSSEFWTIEEFAKLCRKHFRNGKGWTYIPIKGSRELRVNVHEGFGWFYERLEHKQYVEARGTGMVEFIEGKWVIMQYVLSFPVPNALVEKLALQVRKRLKPRKRS